MEGRLDRKEIKSFEGLLKFIDSTIKIAFEDAGQASIKIGRLSGFDDNFVFLKLTDGTEQAIAQRKIIRIEVLK